MRHNTPGQPPPFSAEEFLTHRTRRFGSRNPERSSNKVHDHLIRTLHHPCTLRDALGLGLNNSDEPDFCLRRSGATITTLDDGRVVFIAGEYEDFYDNDFCIYNDVVVLNNFRFGDNIDEGEFSDHHTVDNTRASVVHYLYPKHTFPPTDFHTATLVGDWIYIIGSLGYEHDRKPGSTRVFRLSTRTFKIERVACTGDNPGWIFKHRAQLLGDGTTIRVTHGQVCVDPDDPGTTEHNTAAYQLNTVSRKWTRTRD